MTSEEIIDYLTETDPLTFICEILEVPDDVLEDTIGDAYALADEFDIMEIKQKVLQDMKALAERSLERLIMVHSAHLRKRLDSQED